jgi:hypothetical protein
MSFIPRSGVGGDGAAAGAAAKLAVEGADPDPEVAGVAVEVAPVSVVTAEAAGSADDGDVGEAWLPPHAANDDNPKNTALAAMLRYVQAFMRRA